MLLLAYNFLTCIDSTFLNIYEENPCRILLSHSLFKIFIFGIHLIINGPAETFTFLSSGKQNQLEAMFVENDQ